MNVPDELRQELINHFTPNRGGYMAGVPEQRADHVIAILRPFLERHEAMVIGGKRPHQPVIASRHDGMWGVYCDACSDEAQNYTRCKVREDWPPDVLADPAMVRQKIADQATAYRCAYDQCALSRSPGVSPMPSELRPYLPDVRRDLETALESPVRNISAAIQRILEVHVPNLIAVAEHAAITIKRADQAEAELKRWRLAFGETALEEAGKRLLAAIEENADKEDPCVACGGTKHGRIDECPEVGDQ